MARLNWHEICLQLNWMHYTLSQKISAGISAAFPANQDAGNGLMLAYMASFARGNNMSGFMNDLRFGMRQLIKRPGFAAAAILTLALGIGANTAVFSLLSGYLLKPLPYPHSEQLVRLNQYWVKSDIHDTTFSVPGYLGIRKKTQDVFSALGAYSFKNYGLQSGGKTQRVQAMEATASLFDVFGVKPYLGRTFDRAAQQPGRGHVAVIGYGLWQQAFGGDRNIIGHTVQLNGQHYTITGVMPSKLINVDPRFGAVQLWVPYVMTAKMKSESVFLHQSSIVIGRLKPGVSLGLANRRLTAALQQRAQTSADLKMAMKMSGFEWNARSYHDALVKSETATLYLLQAAVLLVLLIACVNVANLLLARILGRTHELAMRSALGATRSVLARQLLVEGLCLAMPGGLIGVALGWWSLGFASQLGVGQSAVFTITPDWRVGLFAFGAIVLVTLVISLLPIRHFSRIDLQSLLQQGGRSATGSHGARRIRNILAVSEIALAAALLAGAGLLLHSFIQLQGVNPGFATEHRLTAEVWVPPQVKTPKSVGAFWHDFLTRVRALPGVENAGVVAALPLNYHGNGGVTVEGRPNFSVEAHQNYADQHYFATLGLRLLRGRLFNAQDSIGGRRVAVIDEVMARQAFPHENPIGHKFTAGYYESKKTIIGVVSALRAKNLDEANDMGTWYASVYQSQGGHQGQVENLVVHTRLPSYSEDKPIKTLVASIPGASVANFQSMSDLVSHHLQDRQWLMVLILAFGGIALALAVIGVYGVMSYAVSQRRAGR
jgi:predicted permease